MFLCEFGAVLTSSSVFSYYQGGVTDSGESGQGAGYFAQLSNIYFSNKVFNLFQKNKFIF